MKVYALRVEEAEPVIGSLAPLSYSRRQVTSIYRTFVDELAAALRECASEEVRVDVHDYEALERAKHGFLKRGLRYLCLDSQSKIGITFGVSRRFDLKTGRQLGVTSRPGFEELGEQITRLKQMYGTSFGIVEDDIFTGGTIRYVVDLFADHGVTIASVISGISSKEKIGEMPVSSAVYYDPDELLELTDPRDYIFGAREGGIVATHNGYKLRLPYDTAFVDIAARSNVSILKKDDFTRRIRSANFRLHQALGSLNYPAALWYHQAILRYAGIVPGATLRDILIAPFDQASAQK